MSTTTKPEAEYLSKTALRTISRESTAQMPTASLNGATNLQHLAEAPAESQFQDAVSSMQRSEIAKPTSAPSVGEPAETESFWTGFSAMTTTHTTHHLIQSSLARRTRLWSTASLTLLDGMLPQEQWHYAQINYNLVIRNCHFLNQPDSGSHDQGGIDFECGGEANLVEKCTFRNNAGAAIEVLGLISPQTKNIEIANCKFDKNNIAHKLGPSEIFVWGGSKDPAIVCSSGLIRNNGYVLAPEVEFYINKAERTHKDWILKDNTQFNSQQELDQAMPYNNPPVPNAGPEIWTDNPNKVNINGTVTDDGKPLDGKLTTKWETLEGIEVTFENPDKPETAEASFGRRGLQNPAHGG